ncbi:zinc-ribbon domain-containing protein [Companilactobacillus jidongensis]|uniref:zinc-ribbon domain-containing protein n=1 Tax=Companilactobacillus jidongensis TaxID=2486006 RepID=UPI000F77F8A2|nr:zinc ribbon domain-containing protein [Companilactobacillus jidongensis]
MHCSNCGVEIPENAEFCPNCGQKVERVSSASNETVSKNKRTIKPHTKRKTIIKLIVAALVVLVAFLGYRFIYLPTVVKTDVQKYGFTVNGYSTQANVLSKTIVITADEAKVYNLVAASTNNNYSTAQIGAEEELVKMGKALPGSWTIQIIQTTHSDVPRIMWEYSNNQESVRYQDSNEFRQAKQAAKEAAEKKDASDQEVQSALDGFIGSASRW